MWKAMGEYREGWLRKLNLSLPNFKLHEAHITGLVLKSQNKRLFPSVI